MVERRVTDGKRVAQLLASELTGLSVGPLDRVDVADAVPDAEPTSDGTTAYAVTVDGDRAGRVVMYPEGVELVVEGETLSVESGAAVKRTVDALRERLTADADG